MEKAKIRPSPHQKPFTHLRDYVLDGTRHAKFVAIGSGVSVPQIHAFAVLLG